MKIAFLGIGLMGLPMARRLLQAGHEVRVYNRSRAKAEPLAADGATVADSPAAALGGAECAVLMLSDVAAIRAVLFGDESRAALQGCTVIQMGTIAPAHSKALAEECATAGAGYLEAPVLGSIPEAKDGRLIVMAGATLEQFERFKPVLTCIGPAPRLIGPVGQAAAVKLALNQLIASLTAAFSLSLGFVEREGIDVDLFMTILRESALYAPTFDKKLPKMLSRNFANPNFPSQHLLKDLRLFLEEAQTLGLNTSALEGVQPLIEETLRRHPEPTDYSALFEAVVPVT